MSSFLSEQKMLEGYHIAATVNPIHTYHIMVFRIALGERNPIVIDKLAVPNQQGMREMDSLEVRHQTSTLGTLVTFRGHMVPGEAEASASTLLKEMVHQMCFLILCIKITP